MSYIVHITDNCLKNAQYHNTTKGLESLKQVFMDTDDFRLHNLEHRSNGKGIFVKKKFPKKNGRLIIWYRKIGNHQVIIFIAICNVGENDFKKFNHDPIKFVEPFVDEELIERDIIDQTKKLPKKKKPDVKGIEKFLLDQSPIEDSIKPDNWMGETQMWIEAWENEVNRTMLSTVKEKVEDIVTSGKRDIFSIEVGNDKLLYYKNLYIDYRTKDEALILIAFIDNKTQARKEVEKKYEDILLHEDSQSI